MRSLFIKITKVIYRLKRPVLFLVDSTKIHEWVLGMGEFLGRGKILKGLVSKIYQVKSPLLIQTVEGLRFDNPIGLAAGFDYEAGLTQFLPALGFGFETIGTITNQPYGGNQPPMLGRLVKSKSLWVNKGFKNPGIYKTLQKLDRLKFDIPVGLSLGQTNTAEIKTQAEAVQDILSAFQAAENSKAPFSYYELNISCPNLQSPVEFYEPAHLAGLLKEVTGLQLKKPLFVKMPIDKSNAAAEAILDTIVSFPVAGVVLGNLWKERHSPDLYPNEVEKYRSGGFSGLPTQKRSNELIKLAYKKYGQRLTIIGCGGIFSAEDAYQKIKSGASLVQLITGLIFEGPQLAGEINLDLIKLLKKDGFKNISEAIGRGI